MCRWTPCWKPSIIARRTRTCSTPNEPARKRRSRMRDVISGRTLPKAQQPRHEPCLDGVLHVGEGIDGQIAIFSGGGPAEATRRAEAFVADRPDREQLRHR